ncbi:coiled-coil domain-containing protein 181 isoform X2 [Lingula anatina]|uniref:Coiled-coil domain-containing protein 181 n=1 Tax=Lingula anatina TaxID=7574 RepID=A0A1S3J2J4_LINAN|nr:coiled-coil domain-containing protein 181 isoform X2 [Lingula anatina]|eukprot:XP_013404625.1 coiled-coil domain-containing protein 181 isoform X2 [Lingula anatina]
MTEVEGKVHSNKEPDTDSVDQELDWLIEKEEQENHISTEAPSPENEKDNLNTDPHSHKQESDDEDYRPTDDQRAAMAQLEQMRQDLEDDEDDGLGDLPDPPEYNVTERLKQLNKELADEPSPEESTRHHKVVFKDDPVEFVAPPPDDYNSDDEGEDSKDYGASGDSETDDLGVEKLRIGDSSDNDDSSMKDGRGDEVDGHSSSLDGEENSQDNGERKNKVLIERNGKFIMVDADDVEASELEGDSYDAHDDSSEINQSEQSQEDVQPTSSSSSESNNTSVQPNPPENPRPATASGVVRRSGVKPATTSPRAQSAGAYSSSRSNFHYNSPYGLSPAQWELKSQREKALAERQKKEKEQKDKEEAEKKKENDEAFEAWLSNKKREESARRKSTPTKKQLDEEDKKNKEEMKKEADEAYTGWLKKKKEEFKTQKRLETREEKETQEGYYLSPREECDKAFRAWLRKKNAEARMVNQAYRQRTRMHQLLARKSRKSQQLAKAINAAQAYRYVDYYGYRF